MATDMRSAAAALAGPHVVGEAELAECLEIARAAAAGPVEGLLGPGSVTWRIDREAAVFLGAGRALLLQLAHPWVAAAIAQHSPALEDPIGRFHRTFSVIFTMVFGSVMEAIAAAHRLHRRHAAISGVLPAAAGPFPAGSRYLANEAAALQWVHATLVESAVAAHDLVLPPLRSDDRERYWTESRLLGALFGLRPARQPSDWASFMAGNEAMWRSDVLTVTPAARTIASRLLAGTRRLPVPAWYRALTARLLPERLRADFGLPYGEAEARATDRALRWLRRAYPSLPAPLRHVGPYREARRRLKGQPPDLATRALNRIWIGQPRMAQPDVVLPREGEDESAKPSG
jgi:uncharacterized protein (DUF2236 family)